MSPVILLVLLLSGALSKAQVPFLAEPTRKYVLDVVARALEEEDPVVRQALIASIGFPHSPNQGRGLRGHGRVIIFTGVMLLLINFFCLYVILLWIQYVFQKRGIRQRYTRWTAARDQHKELEEYAFKQMDEKWQKAE
jgi:hypothetical protein